MKKKLKLSLLILCANFSLGVCSENILIHLEKTFKCEAKVNNEDHSLDIKQLYGGKLLSYLGVSVDKSIGTLDPTPTLQCNVDVHPAIVPNQKYIENILEQISNAEGDKDLLYIMGLENKDELEVVSLDKSSVTQNNKFLKDMNDHYVFNKELWHGNFYKRIDGTVKLTKAFQDMLNNRETKILKNAFSNCVEHIRKNICKKNTVEAIRGTVQINFIDYLDESEFPLEHFKNLD